MARPSAPDVALAGTFDPATNSLPMKKKLPDTDPRAFRERAFLMLCSFLAGASVMIVEISGNRLIAPTYGNTIFTWTALIGVVLVALSVGAYLGGILADRAPRFTVLGGLLLGGGIFTLVIPYIAVLTGEVVSPARMIMGPLVMSSFLFAIPGILFGAVSPFAVKMLSVLRPDHAVGRSAGAIGMVGSLGSFVGTFLTGFWLLSAFDLRVIILGVGVLLSLLGLVAWWVGHKDKKQLAGLSVLLAAAFAVGLTAGAAPHPNEIFSKNTYYHKVRVLEEDGIRTLMLDSTVEGAIYTARDDSLPMAYQNSWQLLKLEEDFPMEKALFLGAGAFGMPIHLSRHWPDAEIEVAEIDPEVIEVGRRFFRLDEQPQVVSYAADGRVFLQTREDRQYNLIFGDAYSGVSYIPPHMVTREFFELVDERLADGGVYMMNVIGALKGEKSGVVAGVLASMAGVFPHIEVYPVHSRDLYAFQNIVIIASQRSLQAFADPAMVLEPTDQPPTWERIARNHVPRSHLQDAFATRPFTDHRNPIDKILADILLIR